MLSLCAAAQPKAETATAFDHYVQEAEARIEREQNSTELFLALPSFSGSSGLWERVRRGEVVVEKRGSTPASVPGGLIHDWLGVALIPGATLSQVIAFVQDYDHMAPHFQPEMISSRLLSRSGDDFRIAMRLRKHKVVTVVLDTEYDVHYGQLDAAHVYSRSYSTRIAEIANAGRADEHALAPGADHGFLWRLNSYWRFEQIPEGVVVQCEAISLTRGIPTGLGWLIGPFVHQIPRESLQFTLSSTRRGVLERVGQH